MKGEHTHDHISKQISSKLYEFLWCILWTYRRKIYYTLKEVEVHIDQDTLEGCRPDQDHR